jgi:hypothetical protein
MFSYFFLFYKKNLRYEFTNKFNFLNLKVFKINSIILNCKLEIFNLKTVAVYFLILQYLTDKKKGLFINTKKSNLLLKLKKGDPIGCYFYLKKNKLIFLFFKKLILNILSITKIKEKINNNFFLFTINNILLISKFEKFFNIFNILNKTKLYIIINLKKKQKEILFIVKNLKIFEQKKI